MTLGSWDPAAQSAAQQIDITAELVDELVDFSRSGQLDKLGDRLYGDRAQTLAGLMHLPADQWLAAAAPWDADTLRHLIRFFAVAENLPGWEAGEHSPVIPLARTLRQRGEKLERDFLLWLRQVNDNRFLPYGPL